MSGASMGRADRVNIQAMRNEPQGIGDREAAATYIAELSRDLALIARGHGLDALGHIPEMARLEAETRTVPPTAATRRPCACA